MANTTKLTLPLVAASQAQKHVTVNETFNKLDVLVQLNVIDRDLTAPPGSPAEGATYIPAATATGAWAGRENNVAIFQNAAWAFFPPDEGWLAWVDDEDLLYAYNGTAWQSLANLLGSNFLPLAGGTMTGDLIIDKANPKIQFQPDGASGISDVVGQGEELKILVDPSNAGANSALEVQVDGSRRAYINQHGLGLGGAAADATNVLSVNGQSALFNGGAGSTLFKFNKGTVGSDASLAFDTSFSTRALMGLLGNDDFTLKVSPDSSNFHNAFEVNHNTGRVVFPNTRIQNGPQPWNVVERDHVTDSAWSLHTAAAANVWEGITWSDSLRIFVAVSGSGTGNRVMTSKDGITWTSRTSAADNDWRDVVWSEDKGLFVACGVTGIDNRIMTSPDGITWTIRNSSNINEAWESIDYSPQLGLFVVVASTGGTVRVLTSSNGTSWTARTSIPDRDWQSVIWVAELRLFVAVAASGTGSRAMTSPDGINWTVRNTPADHNWNSVSWSPELKRMVAVAGSGTGNRVMTSTDGINWSSVSTPADNHWTSVTWSPELGLFVAVALTGTGNRIMTSPDGWTWTTRTSPADNNWTAVTWSRELGLFAAVARTGTDRAMSSVSGHTAPHKKQRSGAFFAQQISGTPTAGNTLVFAGQYEDNTDSYNTTTGQYTAPLPGWYYFFINLLANNNNAAGVTFSVELRKAGAQFGVGNIVFGETLVANRYHSFNGSAMIELEAGDVITAHLVAGGNIFTGDETYFQGFHIEGIQ